MKLGESIVRDDKEQTRNCVGLSDIFLWYIFFYHTIYFIQYMTFTVMVMDVGVGCGGDGGCY